MILPARGHRTTEFYAAALAAGAFAGGIAVHYDSAIFGGAIILAAYVLSRGIAKAGFGRAVHETSSRRVL